MNNTFRLFMLVNTLFGCNSDRINRSATSCPYADADVRRGSGPVTEVPALIIAHKGGNQQTGYHILPANTTDLTTWGACNLPQSFQEDSLRVYVSGYFLTSPLLETINITPVPFEITNISLRP